MKKMKKMTAVVLSAMLAAMAVTGCGQTQGNVSSTASSADASSVVSQTTDSQASESSAAPSGKTLSSGDKDFSYQKKDDGSIALSYGAILHCWSWSFKTITENLESIKDAGYTSIQTSPINECVVGEDGGMELFGKGKWYYHYQPTDYKIGNYQLGTEDEFKAMCAKAKELGISVIVDVPMNHVSSDMSAVSDNIKNLCDEPFHDNGEINSYSSRRQVTQGDLLALHDLNTQDKAVQNYILDYLKNVIADGASGFRFDAAKHIELPDDKDTFASDFWPTVINNGAEFQYGEILQGENDRIDGYAEFMSVTASNYGEAVRRVCNGNFTVSNISSYGSSKVDESKFVTWVESHDNYCNDGSWENFEESEIEYGWAVIAARAGGAPLFFSRPAGASTEDQWGNNKIGEAGSDGYKSDNVSALNHFRNEMAGLGETITNPDGDSGKVMMIERGDKGAVIINGTTSDYALDAVSVLADGTYNDKVTNAEFTVSGGKITGTVPSGAIIVLY